MKKILLLISLIAFSASANAIPLPPVSATGTGSFNNFTGLIADGVIPNEGSHWQNSTNVWWGDSLSAFTVDFGMVYTIVDVLISIDNNDEYEVMFSENGSTWNQLFKVLVGHGEMGGGMDTMSTLFGHGEYVSGIDFAAVDARYLRVQASGGDSRYSIGELQALGDMVGHSVPDSGSTAFLAFAAFGVIAGIRKQQKKQ